MTLRHHQLVAETPNPKRLSGLSVACPCQGGVSDTNPSLQWDWPRRGTGHGRGRGGWGSLRGVQTPRASSRRSRRSRCWGSTCSRFLFTPHTLSPVQSYFTGFFAFSVSERVGFVFASRLRSPACARLGAAEVIPGGLGHWPPLAPALPAAPAALPEGLSQPDLPAGSPQRAPRPPSCSRRFAHAGFWCRERAVAEVGLQPRGCSSAGPSLADPASLRF